MTSLMKSCYIVHIHETGIDRQLTGIFLPVGAREIHPQLPVTVTWTIGLWVTYIQIVQTKFDFFLESDN